MHESTAIIAVADEFTRNQLEGRLRTRLEDALGHAFGRQVRIAVTVDSELGGRGLDLSGRESGAPAHPDGDRTSGFGGAPAADA
jgi:chromosomal replication initiator protein